MLHEWYGLIRFTTQAVTSYFWTFSCSHIVNINGNVYAAIEFQKLLLGITMLKKNHQIHVHQWTDKKYYLTLLMVIHLPPVACFAGCSPLPNSPADCHEGYALDYLWLFSTSMIKHNYKNLKALETTNNKCLSYQYYVNVVTLLRLVLCIFRNKNCLVHSAYWFTIRRPVVSQLRFKIVGESRGNESWTSTSQQWRSPRGRVQRIRNGSSRRPDQYGYSAHRRSQRKRSPCEYFMLERLYGLLKEIFLWFSTRWSFKTKQSCILKNIYETKSVNNLSIQRLNCSLMHRIHFFKFLPLGFSSGYWKRNSGNVCETNSWRPRPRLRSLGRRTWLGHTKFSPLPT